MPMRKTLLLALLVLLSLGLALLVLEWVYRAQLVDTYRPELHTFNPGPVSAPDGKQALLGQCRVRVLPTSPSPPCR